MYVPLELIALIVEQLAGSRSWQDLRSCSLVCKAWLPTVYRALFYKLDLYPDRPGSNSLIKLSPGLLFPHYVSSLLIQSFLTGDGLDVLPFFDHVRTLSLLNYDHSIHGRLLPRIYPHLHTLNLIFIDFPGGRSLQEFITAFPNLENLVVYRTCYLVDIDNQSADLLPPPRLRNLTLSAIKPHSTISANIRFFHWLSAHPPALERLILYDLTPTEFRPAGVLIHAVSSHLRSLKICLKFPKLSYVIPHPFLGTNTHLHTLEISVMNPTPPLHLHTHLVILDFDTLALRCITLEFRKQVPVNGEEWGTLDAMLARRAPALECLHILVRQLSITGRPQFPVGAHMPYCSKNGIFTGVVVMATTDTTAPTHGKVRSHQ